jgi:hypothetical protein
MSIDEFESKKYSETAKLYRGDGHLVFEGTTVWKYRVYPEDVVSDEKLHETIKHLRGKSWMSDALVEGLTAEVPWLRAQV